MNPQQNKCNKNHTSYIIVKLLKRLKKNLKSVPQITFHTQELMIKMVVDISSEIMSTRRQRNYIFKETNIGWENSQPRILYPQKKTLKSENKINLFPNK